jgi:hypothetical protein
MDEKNQPVVVGTQNGKSERSRGGNEMSIWAVKFYGKLTPVNVQAYYFTEAVIKAVKYAKEQNIPEDSILSVDYLGY